MEAKETKLMELSNRWKKNADAFGFEALVRLNGEKLHILLTGVPQTYQDAVRRLAKEMVSLAMSVLAEAFSYEVLSQDAELELVRVQEFLKRRIPCLLNRLFLEGAEVFYKQIAEDADILKLQYRMRTLSCTSDGWYLWDGTRFDMKE